MEKTADGRKEKAVKKQREKKYALKTMMKQEERDLIQKMKDEEREKATPELEAAVEKPPIKLTNNRDKVQTLPRASRGCSGNPRSNPPPEHAAEKNKWTYLHEVLRNDPDQIHTEGVPHGPSGIPCATRGGVA